MKGAGSTAGRQQRLRDLLRRATRAEQDFIVRLLFGELRQGALEGVLVEAVAKASGISAASLRRAVMMAGALAPVARAAIVDGEAGLATFGVQLFQPVQPMLALPAEDMNGALAQLHNDVSLEWKLDGARIQAHKRGDEVRVFSRESARRHVGRSRSRRCHASARGARVDPGWRGHRASCGRLAASIPGHDAAVRPEARCGPVALRDPADAVPLRLPLCRWRVVDRHDAGCACRPPRDHRAVDRRPCLVRPTSESAERFLDETLRRGHEGLMVKSLAAPYAAGRRGQRGSK